MNRRTAPQFNLDIPELTKLGRPHFPGISTNDFWRILQVLSEGEICPDNEDDWAYAEERTRMTLPVEFRRIYHKPLTFWQVFEWGDRGTTPAGVLRHTPSGLCRPAIRDCGGEFFMIGDSLEAFSRQAGALACLELFRAFCAWYDDVPGGYFINHQPKSLLSG